MNYNEMRQLVSILRAIESVDDDAPEVTKADILSALAVLIRDALERHA
jgi:hypothetical protein